MNQKYQGISVHLVQMTIHLAVAKVNQDQTKRQQVERYQC